MGNSTEQALEDRTVTDAQAVTGSVEVPPHPASAKVKLVYLYLCVVSSARLREFRDDLHMDKLTLYPVLESLIERDLVERAGAEYRLADLSAEAYR